MTQLVKKFLRWALTVVMIYGAYTETGHWTAASLFLIFVGIEASAHTTTSNERQAAGLGFYD